MKLIIANLVNTTLAGIMTCSLIHSLENSHRINVHIAVMSLCLSRAGPVKIPDREVFGGLGIEREGASLPT